MRSEAKSASGGTNQKSFKEINRLAAEKIGEALRKLSGQEMKVELSEVAKKEVREIKAFFSAEEKIVTLYLPISGALEGGSVFIFPAETAFALADYLQKRALETTRVLTELDKSALKELGNIVSCQYLNVISNELKVEVSEHGARFSFDIFGAIAEEIIAQISKDKKETLILEIVFTFESQTRTGKILFLFEPKKMEELFGGGGGNYVWRVIVGERDRS